MEQLHELFDGNLHSKIDSASICLLRKNESKKWESAARPPVHAESVTPYTQTPLSYARGLRTKKNNELPSFPAVSWKRKALLRKKVIEKVEN